MLQFEAYRNAIQEGSYHQHHLYFHDRNRYKNLVHFQKSLAKDKKARGLESEDWALPPKKVRKAELQPIKVAKPEEKEKGNEKKAGRQLKDYLRGHRSLENVGGGRQEKEERGRGAEVKGVVRINQNGVLREEQGRNLNLVPRNTLEVQNEKNQFDLRKRIEEVKKKVRKIKLKSIEKAPQEVTRLKKALPHQKVGRSTIEDSNQFPSQSRNKSQIVVSNRKESPKKGEKKLYLLVNEEHSKFLEQYEKDLIRNHLKNDEERSQLYDLGRHPHVSENLRAKLIDWIFHVHSLCTSTDPNIPFVAISLVDKFYQLVEREEPKESLQLTAIAAIFIASKLIQVEPISAFFCERSLGHYKYSSRQILEREEEILSLCQFDVYSDPSLYETFDFLISLLKVRVQDKLKRLESVKYVKNVQGLSQALLKSSLLATANYSFSNALRVASLVQLAVAYNAIDFKTSDPHLMKEIMYIMSTWSHIVEHRLSFSLSTLREAGFQQMRGVFRINQSCTHNFEDSMTFPRTFQQWLDCYLTQNSLEEAQDIFNMTTEEDEELVQAADVRKYEEERGL